VQIRDKSGFALFELFHLLFPRYRIGNKSTRKPSTKPALRVYVKVHQSKLLETARDKAADPAEESPWAVWGLVWASAAQVVRLSFCSLNILLDFLI